MPTSTRCVVSPVIASMLRLSPEPALFGPTVNTSPFCGWPETRTSHPLTPIVAPALALYAAALCSVTGLFGSLTSTRSYVVSLVKNGPHQAEAKKVLDFLLSDQGQAIWANAYLRPVRASAMSKEAEARFLPAAEYARAKSVDYGKMAEAQRKFGERYLAEVR